MGDQELRLECLKLANTGLPYEDVIEAARGYYDFATGIAASKVPTAKPNRLKLTRRRRVRVG